MSTSPNPVEPSPFNEQLWHTIFAEGHPLLIDKQRAFRAQGAPPRCKLCLAPFGATSATPVPADTPGPSNRNPRYCSLCDVFIRNNPGGAKVSISMVFVDVRGSTQLAEELPLEEYVRLINQFYATATSAFVETDGFMMDVIGDEVFALYPSGFSGISDEPQTLRERQRLAAQKALRAVERLAERGRVGMPDALPFGVSLHTGEVYIGTVRGAEEGIFDVRVWGAEVNRAARLCSVAKPGEALISDGAAAVLGLQADAYERRELQLRGAARPGVAFVLPSRAR
jgi:adenylate cyclase